MDPRFTAMVDNILHAAESDQDLAKALNNIGEKADIEGLSLYEKMFLIFRDWLAESREKEWMQTRTK